MPGDADPPFEPWYDYLSALELLVLAWMVSAALATLCVGATDPGTDLNAAVGLAVLVAGFVAFHVRWAVAEARTAVPPT